ncbi:lactonase family protein [Streptomyces sp. RFCAC02]|uniref:lactonase family protein n=1 Tax=Streptomyces sp. RFCAC02 TaxID=2499143 RepID=UPI00101E978C|nr:lactonase family protein [Streptomyces sp. RFCAC02]
MSDRLFCVGSYTAETGGRGPGITLLREDGRGGRLVPAGELALPGCSWLEWHPTLPVLYTVHERAEGGVSAIRFAGDGEPEVVGGLPTGGAEPCHLAVTPDGRHLLAANYGSGSVAVFSLDEAGVPVARTDLVRLTGSGPVPDRQEGPHAHMVTLDAAGSLVTVVDLGTDTLWSYRLDPGAGTLTRSAASGLPAGTGPRQLVRAATGRAHVVAELAAGLVTVAEETPGVFTALASSPASARPGAGADQPAHLVISADGRTGHLSNRGADTIATFALGTDTPKLTAEYVLGAAWPRHFTVDGDRMLVAAQESDAVLVLTLDTVSGAPVAEEYRLSVGSPACVVSRPVGTRS